MVKPIRGLALGLAFVAALSFASVPAARAADVPTTSDVGALRVAHVLARRVLPWILTIVEEFLEQLPQGDPPPQPPPFDPTAMDPEFTP